MVTLSFIAFAGVLGLLAVVDYLLIARAVRRGPARVALGAAEPAEPSPAPALVL
jgi:cytochrome d ubiquinol oxidase subunit I